VGQSADGLAQLDEARQTRSTSRRPILSRAGAASGETETAALHP
jgi:hypothetical protein